MGEKPARLAVDDLKAAADDIRHAGFVMIHRQMLDVAFDMVVAQITGDGAIKKTVDRLDQRHGGYAVRARWRVI